MIGERQPLPDGQHGYPVAGSHDVKRGLGKIHQDVGVLTNHVTDRARSRTAGDPYLVPDAGEELQSVVSRRITVPHRRARLQMIGGVPGGRITAVHSQGDRAHARQDKGPAIRVHPVGMPVGQGRPDLPRQHLAGQPHLVSSQVHDAAAMAGASSGKSTQARRRKDSSNALIVSCTSAPWAKSP